MEKHPTLFVTHRGERHQQAAIEAAPPELEITVRRSPSKEEVIALLPGKEFLISERTGTIDAEIIAAGKDLRLIQRWGSQQYDIDLEAARRAGIPVCYWPVRTCVMVAEHMMMQLLVIAKRLREMMQITEEAGDWRNGPQLCDEDTFSYNWSEREDIRGLYGSTVGIVGFGEIGTELARRLQNYECCVLYNKRTRLPQAAEMELEVEYTELDELLGRSDFVCMLLPYFSETAKIVNAGFLDGMKQGASLVGCGGSGTFDEDAIAQALASGKLYGFATDTYVWEPINQDSPLLSLTRETAANVYLTPHTAAGTTAADSSERIDDYANIRSVLQDRPLRYRLV
jgi:phosphoglycerate dehydrogenase-like enzyme